jgi:hypothetical protein
MINRTWAGANSLNALRMTARTPQILSLLEILLRLGDIAVLGPRKANAGSVCGTARISLPYAAIRRKAKRLQSPKNLRARRNVFVVRTLAAS